MAPDICIRRNRCTEALLVRTGFSSPLKHGLHMHVFVYPLMEDKKAIKMSIACC